MSASKVFENSKVYDLKQLRQALGSIGKDAANSFLSKNRIKTFTLYEGAKKLFVLKDDVHRALQERAS